MKSLFQQEHSRGSQQTSWSEGEPREPWWCPGVTPGLPPQALVRPCRQEVSGVARCSQATWTEVAGALCNLVGVGALCVASTELGSVLHMRSELLAVGPWRLVGEKAGSKQLFTGAVQRDEDAGVHGVTPGLLRVVSSSGDWLSEPRNCKAGSQHSVWVEPCQQPGSTWWEQSPCGSLKGSCS